LFVSLNLILVTSDVVSSDTQLRYLLDLVFNSMVLMVGLQLLETDAANTEKLKRELKVREREGVGWLGWVKGGLRLYEMYSKYGKVWHE